MKIVFLTILDGYKENMMKINGDQLKQVIRILSKNFEMDYILNAVFSQLTTKQLGEVVRYMLNDVKYSKELNVEDSLVTGVPVFEDIPMPNFEEVFKQQIKDMIDEGKSLEQIKTFINDNTGVHIN